jgi:hypothetical protein
MSRSWAASESVPDAGFVVLNQSAPPADVLAQTPEPIVVVSVVIPPSVGAFRKTWLRWPSKSMSTTTLARSRFRTAAVVPRCRMSPRAEPDSATSAWSECTDASDWSDRVAIVRASGLASGDGWASWPLGPALGEAAGAAVGVAAGSADAFPHAVSTSEIAIGQQARRMAWDHDSETGMRRSSGGSAG